MRSAGRNEFPTGEGRITAFGHFIACMPRRTKLICASLLLLILFLSNGRVIGQIDAIPAALLPIALLIDGSVTYDKIIEGLGRGEAPDGFSKTAHGLVSFFPIMTGLMALPIYAPAIGVKKLFASPSSQDWVKFAWRFQKLPAAVFATLAVLTFWRLCEAIELPCSLSICLTLWLAFGSQLFSVGAQSLWQHGPGTLAVIATVDAQVRLRNRPTSTGALLLSTFCGLAIAIRPTNILIVGPFGLLGLMQQPRLWLPLAAPVSAILSLLIVYNLHFFGLELGGYAWAPSTFAIANLAHGLPGLLFSPSRGLMIYFMITAVTAAALTLQPRTVTDPTAAAAFFGAVLTLLLFSNFPWWWGGWSYGPRYLSEIEPLVLLLLGLAWRRMDRPLRRGFLAAAFGLLPFGVLVQAVGVYSAAAVNWNGIPVNIDQATSRLWDVADNPIFRGLHISSSR